MADPRAREIRNRSFADPEVVLRDMRVLERTVTASPTPDRVKRLRTGPLKPERESRDAALFAHGMSHYLGTKVLVSPGEISDADFLTCIPLPDRQVITFVQLKSLVPSDLNAQATISGVIAGVAKLPPTETVLAVLINREMQIDLAELAGYRVPFSELWFFWASTRDQSQWQLYGNIHADPRLCSFAYPT